MAQAMKALSSLSSRLQMFRLRNLSTHKDLIQPQLQTGPDLLLQNIKNATTTTAVLEMVQQHGNIMNNRHVIQALSTLFTLQKYGNTDLSTKDILLNSNFSKLCKQLKNEAGKIEINDTIEALKVVSYVGVPSDSTIVQVLLRLLKYNINHLGLHQIIFVDFLLEQFKSTPLVEALKIALPVVFEIQMPVKMDRENAVHLADYLQYASTKQLSDNCVQKIVNALMQFRGDLDVKTAKSIIWSICSLDHNEYFQPLLQDCLDIVGANLKELSFNDLELTLTKLIFKYNKYFPFFYDEIFYTTCANHIIDQNRSFEEGVFILKKFNKVSYSNKALLDYVSSKVFEQPDLIRNADPVVVYHIISAAAMTDYKPIHWENLKNLIMEKENLSQSSKKEIKWLKFAEALCLTNIFRVDALNRCFEPKFLDFILENRPFPTNIISYITIWQSINLYRPELKCLLSTKYTPENLIRILYKDYDDFPFKGALYNPLGGENYVKTGLLSRYGAFIDHAVIFRKGGFPVADNQDVEFIEDLQVSPDNQLVLIVGLKSYQYTLNKMLRSSADFGVKFLESKGYTVVPVCLESWTKLPDFEKIPYLMQKIKEKSDWNISLESMI